jgi:hypothetical protein
MKVTIACLLCLALAGAAGYAYGSRAMHERYAESQKRCLDWAQAGASDSRELTNFAQSGGACVAEYVARTATSTTFTIVAEEGGELGRFEAPDDDVVSPEEAAFRELHDRHFPAPIF